MLGKIQNSNSSTQIAFGMNFRQGDRLFEHLREHRDIIPQIERFKAEIAKDNSGLTAELNFVRSKPELMIALEESDLDEFAHVGRNNIMEQVAIGLRMTNPKYFDQLLLSTAPDEELLKAAAIKLQERLKREGSSDKFCYNLGILERNRALAAPLEVKVDIDKPESTYDKLVQAYNHFKGLLNLQSDGK